MSVSFSYSLATVIQRFTFFVCFVTKLKILCICSKKNRKVFTLSVVARQPIR